MTRTFGIKRLGVTSLEVVIGVSIAGVIIAYAANSVTQFVNSARNITTQTQALYLAEEGLELLRFVRDEEWSDLSSVPVDATRHLNIAPTDITITAVPETIGEFTRSFSVQNVYRNGADDIVASTTGGSVADTDSKYVTVNVSWGNPVKSVTVATILTNLTP